MVRVGCEVWKSEIPFVPLLVMEELHFLVPFFTFLSFLALPFLFILHFVFSPSTYVALTI